MSNLKILCGVFLISVSLFSTEGFAQISGASSSKPSASYTILKAKDMVVVTRKSDGKSATLQKIDDKSAEVYKHLKGLRVNIADTHLASANSENYVISKGIQSSETLKKGYPLVFPNEQTKAMIKKTMLSDPIMQRQVDLSRAIWLPSNTSAQTSASMKIPTLNRESVKRDSSNSCGNIGESCWAVNGDSQGVINECNQDPACRTGLQNVQNILDEMVLV